MSGADGLTPGSFRFTLCLDDNQVHHVFKLQQFQEPVISRIW